MNNTMYTAAQLTEMTYREVQALAKIHNIRANQSKSDMSAQLLRMFGRRELVEDWSRATKAVRSGDAHNDGADNVVLWGDADELGDVLTGTPVDRAAGSDEIHDWGVDELDQESPSHGVGDDDQACASGDLPPLAFAIRCKLAENGLYAATIDVGIGGSLLIAKATFETPLHPNEGHVDPKTHAPVLDISLGVHMLVMFAQSGSWENVARALFSVANLDILLEDSKQFGNSVRAMNANLMGQTIGNLLQLTYIDDEWVRAQLEPHRDALVPDTLFSGVDPWLYLVIHGMQVTNTASVPSPVFNVSDRIMRSYADLSSVYSPTMIPTDFNAIMLPAASGDLFIMAMRPIKAGEHIVVVMSDAMAISPDDKTNLNILNLLMALRKMVGGTQQLAVVTQALDGIGDLPIPGMSLFGSATQAFRDDPVKSEKVRNTMMACARFGQGLASFERRATELKDENDAHFMAIQDTIAAIFSSIRIHATTPGVWLEHRVCVTEAADEMFPLTDDDEPKKKDTSTKKKKSSKRTFSSTKKKGKKARAADRVVRGIEKFDHVTKNVGDASPYCMFMTLAIVAHHAQLVESELPWVPAGVLDKFDKGSIVYGVLDKHRQAMVKKRVAFEMKSIMEVYGEIDHEFVNSLEEEMSSHVFSDNVQKLMAVLEAGSALDSTPDDDDDDAKTDDDIVVLDRETPSAG